MMTESDIVNGCKKGRREAQRALYDALATHLMAIAVRYMGNHEDAQDVLQDALVKAYLSFDQFTWKGEGSLQAWLHRIVVNTAVSQLRQRQHLPDVVNIDSVPEHEEQLDAGEVAHIDTDTILSMEAALPTGYRTVFNMHCIDGYSHRDIARQLGINEGTSSSQLSRARAILAHKIKEYINQHTS